MSRRPRGAFVCVHNACRSQMAEAIARILAGDVFDSFSAGTETKPAIDPTAVRLVREQYGVDMTENQYSKTLDALPEVDVVQPETYAGMSTVDLGNYIYEMMAQDLGPENVSTEE